MVSTFLQVAELWISRAERLGLHSGSYGQHSPLRGLSADLRFELGEGFVGSVWSSQKPLVARSIEHTHVTRIKASDRPSLDSALGIPIAAGGRSTHAVMALLCGHPDARGGCIERWDMDDECQELRHSCGYYGELLPFAQLSPHLRFGMGNGLPGQTAKRGVPTILEDVRRAGTFLRAEIARECGLAMGLGVPVYRQGRVAHVLLLLSAESCPLARAVEVWLPAQSDALKLDQASYTRGLDDFAGMSRALRVRSGEDIVGLAYRSEMPVICTSLEAQQFTRAEAARAAGLEVALAIPIHDGRNVVAVLVLCN